MKWSRKRIKDWYAAQPWLCGFNYLPRSSVNYTEMWQSTTFNPREIAQELAWAHSYGFNTLRVVLSYVVWQQDPGGLKRRLTQFLNLADRNHLKTVICLLDDCGFSGDHPFAGPQKQPTPGVHNSQAAASPGRNVVTDPKQWPEVERYVRDFLTAFADDRRVLFWDLYNEPGNDMIFKADGEHRYESPLEEYSAKLMQATFEWAWQIAPSQPLSVAGWRVPPFWEVDSQELYAHPIDQQAFELSDVITFHAYCTVTRMERIVEMLRAYDRPLICTEWMARHVGSQIAEQLPLFHREQIGCYQWGLVRGRTQTHIPWPAVFQHQSEAANSALWFHDFLHPDGAAFDPSEADAVRRLTAPAHQQDPAQT